MNDQRPAVRAQLIEWASLFGGRPAKPESRLYADLGINGSDFIEFIEKVERAYRVDLFWISPRGRRAEAQDATIGSIVEYVVSQQ